MKCKYCGKDLLKGLKSYCGRPCSVRGRFHTPEAKLKAKLARQKLIASKGEYYQSLKQRCNQYSASVTKNWPKIFCKFCRELLNQRIKRQKNFCSRSCRNKFHNNQWQKGLKLANRNPSKLELLLREELQKRNILFEVGKKIGVYFPDILIRSQKVIIEADGEYWHSLGENRKRRKRRDQYFRDNGYKIFHFKEKDILASPSSCIDKIPPNNLY